MNDEPSVLLETTVGLSLVVAVAAMGASLRVPRNEFVASLVAAGSIGAGYAISENFGRKPLGAAVGAAGAMLALWMVAADRPLLAATNATR